MIVKQLKHHQIIQSPNCGEIREILTKDEYSPNIALAINIGETKAHYHSGFDEIYFVLDGSLTLKLYDPSTKETIELLLKANELCVITKGIHHKIVKGTKQNRLCVITVPKFNMDDKIQSNKI